MNILKFSNFLIIKNFIVRNLKKKNWIDPPITTYLRRVKLLNMHFQSTTFHPYFSNTTWSLQMISMSFRLTKSRTTPQNLMNQNFHHVLKKYVIVLFDDVLVYGPSWTMHLVHFIKVLQTVLQQHSLYMLHLSSVLSASKKK